jgi:hypothetical protein
MRGQPCETNAAHAPAFRVVLLALVGLAFAAILGFVSLADRGDAGTSTRLSPAQGVSAVRNDQGLQLALSVPRGPYFRTELLPVTLVLTNNSGTPIPYLGSLPGGACSYPTLEVRLASGSQDVGPLSLSFAISCPSMPAVPHTLRPGRSLRLTTMLGLPTGGRLTLTALAHFLPGAGLPSPGLPDPGGHLAWLHHLVPALFASRHAPFASGWPSLTLRVAATVPPGRLLHLVRHGHTVVVFPHPSAPVFSQEMAVSVDGQGTCLMELPWWWPLRAGTLADNRCGGAHEKWQVLVGAPGYAIASAVYCFDPVPSMVFGGVRGAPQGMGPRCTERVRQ